MKNLTTTLFFLVLCIVGNAQAPNLTNWKIDTLPTADRIYAANHAGNHWTFVSKGGNWEIVQNDYSKEKGDTLSLSAEIVDKNLIDLKANRFVKRTPDGYLVGLHKGEFGGGLYFIKSDGLDGYKIADHLNIRNIFEYKARYFALEGLAHLGSQRGQIIEIFQEDNVWKYKPMSALIEAPALITDFGNEKLIVTSQYILKLGEDLKVTEVLKAPFYWGMLYPSSILVDNTDLYLAMRQGLLKIKSFDSAPEYIWHTPK